jgi:hypothetical protein
VKYRSLRGAETPNARRAAVGRAALTSYLAELSGRPSQLDDEELTAAARDLVVDVMHALAASVKGSIEITIVPRLLDQAQEAFGRELREGSWTARREFAR